MFSTREERRKAREEKQRLEEQERLEKEKYEQSLKELEEKASDYVLTISASDYVNRSGTELLDYNFKSVYAKSGYCEVSEGDEIYKSALVQIVEQGLELGAEKIVDVRPSHYAYYTSSSLFLIGTALIPKK